MTPPVNGWRIFIHESLEQQLLKLAGTVAWMHMSEQSTAKNGQRKKVLKAIKRAMYESVPASPGRIEHRLGHTLGRENTAWFRVKVLQQFRLFYRYDSSQKVIVYVWINDEDSLRAYGSKTDAYALFAKMLVSGYPPGSFEELVSQSREL
ncbi:MAG: type II toxin-antitoxin system YhaV family toxin [Micrococcales bacterium]